MGSPGGRDTWVGTPPTCLLGLPHPLAPGWGWSRFPICKTGLGVAVLHGRSRGASPSVPSCRLCWPNKGALVRRLRFDLFGLQWPCPVLRSPRPHPRHWGHSSRGGGQALLSGGQVHGQTGNPGCEGAGGSEEGVADRVTAPKDGCVLIAGICDYVIFFVLSFYFIIMILKIYFY